MISKQSAFVVGAGLVLSACGGDPSSGVVDTESRSGSVGATSLGSARMPSPADVLAKGVVEEKVDLGAAQASASVKSRVLQPFDSKKLTAPIEEYVPFPGGKYMHQSCVHSFPSGAHIADNGDVMSANGDVIEHVEPCRYEPIVKTNPEAPPGASGNGNIEYFYAHPGTSPWFDGVAAQVVVPPAPTSFRLFAGIQVSLWSGAVSQLTTNRIVAQPVLQWGDAGLNCSSGGQKWEMEVYYIDINNNAYCGAQNQVNAGDTISEYTLAASCPDNSGVNCNWLVAYVWNDNTYGGYTGNIPVKLDSVIFQSLEAYNVPDCSYFPNTTGTGFLALWYQPSPSWNSYNQQTAVTGFQKGPSVDPATNVPSNCKYGLQGGFIAQSFLGELLY